MNSCLGFRRTLVAAVILATSACGGGSTSPSTSVTPTPTPTPAPSTTFQGTIAGTSGQTGTITATFPTTIATSSLRTLTVSSGTGTVHLTGKGTSTLTGTYDSATNAVALSGGGFTFTGSISKGVMSGTYTNQDVTGGFSGVSAGTGSITTYCGTYTSTVPFTGPGVNGQPGVPGIYQEAGTWNVQVGAGGVASGVSFPTSYSYTGGNGPAPAASPNFLTGQLSGTTLSLTSGEGGTATVTVQGTSVSGTVASPSGKGSGTFTGNSAACQ